jgi:hypothetical protein
MQIFDFRDRKNLIIGIFLLLFFIISVFYIYSLEQTKKAERNLFSGSGDPYDSRTGGGSGGTPLIQEPVLSCEGTIIDIDGKKIDRAICGGGILVEGYDSDSKNIQNRAIVTTLDERGNQWENYFYSYWCITEQESERLFGTNPKPGDITKIKLTLGAEDFSRQIHCFAPVKQNIEKRAEFFIRQNNPDADQVEFILKNIFSNMLWPKEAYRFCISDNCSAGWRSVYAALRLGTNEIVRVNTGGISTFIPINVIGSIFDLFDPVNRPPKRVGETWTSTFPNVIKVEYGSLD